MQVSNTCWVPPLWQVLLRPWKYRGEYESWVPDLIEFIFWWSEVSQSCLILCDPMTGACQVPPSMGFSRQEYWSGFPFPTSGDLPDPQFKLVSLVSSALASRFFNSVSPGKPLSHYSQLLSVWLIICQFTSLDSSLFAYKMRPVYQSPFQL